MSSGVACTCQVIGQRDADPTAAAIVLSTESLWAAVGGLVILHEKMSALAYIGCALMLCGIIVSQVKLGRRKNGAPKRLTHAGIHASKSRRKSARGAEITEINPPTERRSEI